MASVRATGMEGSDCQKQTEWHACHQSYRHFVSDVMRAKMSAFDKLTRVLILSVIL